jgi:hypothetical protein
MERKGKNAARIEHRESTFGRQKKRMKCVKKMDAISSKNSKPLYCIQTIKFHKPLASVRSKPEAYTTLLKLESSHSLKCCIHILCICYITIMRGLK